MSVKKSGKLKEDKDKKSNKGKKQTKNEMGKKSSSKKVQKDIKKAVDNFSGLIFEGMKQQMKTPPKIQIINTPPTNTSSLKPLSYEYHREQGKRRMIVWVGVGITTLVVFIMWGLNASTFISDTKNSEKKSDEREILESAGGDIKAIIEATTNNEETDSNEITEKGKEENLDNYVNIDELKASLAGILSNINATPTNTLEQNTTTTIKLSTTTLSE